MEDRYYLPSGQFSPVGLGIALAASCVVGWLLGVIYGVVDCWMPLIYINLLVCLGAGLASGVAASLFSQMAHNRNRMMRLVIGATTSSFVIYGAWVGWFWALTSHQDYVLRPDHLWAILIEVGEEGVWQIRDLKPSGAFLYGIWAIEAATIFGITIMTCMSDRTPYCEACQTWTTEQQGALVTDADVPLGDIVAALESEDYSVLEALPHIASNAILRWDLNTCETCPEGPHYLSLEKVVVTIDNNGKENKSTTTIFKNLVVGRAEVELIAQNAERVERELREAIARAEAEAGEEKGGEAGEAIGGEVEDGVSEAEKTA